MNELFLQQVVTEMRKQLDWEIKKGEAFYNHLAKCIQALEEPISVEEFVFRYRLTFKPGYPNHPTGNAIPPGFEEGDMFLMVTRENNSCPTKN